MGTHGYRIGAKGRRRIGRVIAPAQLIVNAVAVDEAAALPLVELADHLARRDEPVGRVHELTDLVPVDFGRAEIEAEPARRSHVGGVEKALVLFQRRAVRLVDFDQHRVRVRRQVARLPESVNLFETPFSGIY